MSFEHETSRPKPALRGSMNTALIITILCSGGCLNPAAVPIHGESQPTLADPDRNPVTGTHIVVQKQALECKPGSRWPNDCNTCICPKSGLRREARCTRLACHPKKRPQKQPDKERPHKGNSPSKNGVCTVPCTGMAPHPGVVGACRAKQTSKACRTFRARAFPYQCQWIPAGTVRGPCTAP